MDALQASHIGDRQQLRLLLAAGGLAESLPAQP
jgi:hypothetical protein